MHKPETPRSALGDFLDRYARERGGELINEDGTVNTAKLAALLDLSQSHVYRLISGGTMHPRYETVRQVSRRTGVAEAVILDYAAGEPVSPHALEIARKLELLTSGDRAIIEAMADRFIELIEAAEESVEDTGRFDIVEVTDGVKAPLRKQKKKVRS